MGRPVGEIIHDNLRLTSKGAAAAAHLPRLVTTVSAPHPNVRGFRVSACIFHNHDACQHAGSADVSLPSHPPVCDGVWRPG